MKFLVDVASAPGPGSVFATQNGGYVLVVLDDSERYPKIMKLDANGEKEWVKNIRDPVFGQDPLSVRQTEDGGYVVMGITNFGKAIMLLKLDSEGNQFTRN